MSNYYEDTMPILTNDDEYRKYYFEESLPTFDRLNTIIKKGEPFQRQALIKNLIIFVKQSLFKSLIQFIISDIGTWDSETILLFPKSLYLLLINTNYILDNELFNIIFKHMILSVSAGAEKNRCEYIYYFNKVIEFYSFNDTKINKSRNVFPYKIDDEIIEIIINLGKFGQTASNRRLCGYLSSSLCRIETKNTQKNNEDTIKELYKRLSYLFCDGDKIIEAQMVRELLYIIPLFKDIMFTNEDINQAIESYINHDSDHVIQTMSIIALVKNMIYISEEKKIINILLNKIKEIIKDNDYEIQYKNIIVELLINILYINYKTISPDIAYKVIELDIIGTYYDFRQLQRIHIQNFDKIFFLYNHFCEEIKIDNLEEPGQLDASLDMEQNIKAPLNQKGIKENNNNNNEKINFDDLFIKIYNNIFKKDIDYYINTNESELSYINKEKNNISLYNNDNNQFNNTTNNNDNIFNFNNNFLGNFDFSDIECIFNKENNQNNINNNDLRNLLYLYLPKIIPCLSNIKANRNLCEKFLNLFQKNNTLMMLNIYSSTISANNNQTDKNPFYEIFLVLLKKNYKLFTLSTKHPNKISNSKDKEKDKDKDKDAYYECNIFNRLINIILSNIIILFQESPSSMNSDIHLLISRVFKLLIPKFYKYYKNITYNVPNISNTNGNMNNSSIISCSTNKEMKKEYYFEKIYEEIFNNYLSKIIINNNLGSFIIKEYIEIFPYYIMYSKNREIYLSFIKSEILSADSFYKRRYSITFCTQCFKVLSFDMFCKLNIYSDFVGLMKDKINLLSTNIIEIVLFNSKKIIAFSVNKFKELCSILNVIYDLNIKAFNNDSRNFDREKNKIINKIININNNINNYYTKEEINLIKDNENKLITKENEILKHEKIIITKKINSQPNLILVQNNSSTNNNSNIMCLNSATSNFHIMNCLPINSLSSTFQSQKNSSSMSSTSAHKLMQSMFNSTNSNSNNSHFPLSVSQKEKSSKLTPWTGKSTFYQINHGASNYNSNNSNNNYNNGNINNSNNSQNYPSKNGFNKQCLPKLRGLKINRKELNNGNNNLRGNDATFSKLNSKVNKDNILNNKINGIEMNPTKNILQNDLRLISFTKNRLPSAKIKLKNSYPIIINSIVDDMNINLNMNSNKNSHHNNKISSSTKNNSVNNCNNNNNFSKSISNKHIALNLKQENKNVKSKKESSLNMTRIYIDANKTNIKD